MSEEKFLKEAKIAKKMGELKSVENFWVGELPQDTRYNRYLKRLNEDKAPKAGYIISEKLDLTVERYRRKFPKEYQKNKGIIARKTKETINKMHALVILYSDTRTVE